MKRENRTSDEILKHIVGNIAHAYLRPMMYADTAEGLDSLLWEWHRLWAYIEHRELAFYQALDDFSRTLPHPYQSFLKSVREQSPTAPERELMTGVIPEMQPPPGKRHA